MMKNINENNKTLPKLERFFNSTKQEQTTNNQKENTMNTTLTTITKPTLPNVSILSNLTGQQLTKCQGQANHYLTALKYMLNKENTFITKEYKKEVCLSAIYISDWLLHADVELVKKIKQESRNFGKNIADVYKEYDLKRKEWENRKDLTAEIVDKIKQESLSKLNSGKWSTNDIPTISKALKEIKKNKSAKMEILAKGGYKQLPIPDKSKFLIIYASLADDIDIKELSKHIADNAVGFFWLDDSNIQQSFKTINDLGFVIKELACWDTSKSHNGAFTTKQQHNMVVACKGKAFRPSTFRLDSVFFEYENKGSKPIYYAEIIRQMFPNLAVLEVHNNDFKYIATDYTLGDIKIVKNK